MSREIQEAMTIFRQVCDLPAGAREEALDRACGDDQELRRQVESMLAWDGGNAAAGAVESGGSTMEEKFADLLGAPPDGGTPGGLLPESIGRYRVVRLIAQGGMGAVYEALQDNPTRRVAVKLAHVNRTSTELVRRFELEAQLLARLDHPGIARIIEAGTTGPELGSRPFFAMELVEGVTLRDHAAACAGTVADKVALLLRVCEAVAYAHGQGVTHRDLKPDNVLVDARGAPRILDFGIAKVAAAGGFGAVTMRTEVGRILGTLGYMAPEQLAGQTATLGPAADVYALGVMLYELLAGRMPHELGGVTPSQALLMVANNDAPRLGRACPELGGDLEAVVAKALEPEPDSRYRDARALQADLERYLRGEPVEARRHTAYRSARKLVCGVAASVAALLLGFATARSWFEGDEVAPGAAARAAKLARDGVWTGRWIDFGHASQRVRADRLVGFPSTSLTVEFWVRHTGGPLDAALFSYSAPHHQNELLIEMANNLRAILRGTVVGHSGIDVTDGRWHHVGLVWQAETGALQWYHNGVLVSAAKAAVGGGLDQGGTLVLAEDQDRFGSDFRVENIFSAAQALIGQMADVRVWSVARTADQIQRHMERELEADAPGLALHWRMDAFEDLGVGFAGVNDVRDLSPNGNHGDAENGAGIGGR